MMLLAHGSFVLAMDGAHMRLLRNQARGGAIDLIQLEGADAKQGRPRKAVFEEAAIYHALRIAQNAEELVIVAPPPVLGALRVHLRHHRGHPHIRELSRDLAQASPKEITLHLRAVA